MYPHATSIVEALVDISRPTSSNSVGYALVPSWSTILEHLPSNVVSLDIETGLIDVLGTPGAYDDNAYPMIIGCAWINGDRDRLHIETFTEPNNHALPIHPSAGTPPVVIGHNIKFDIQHLLRRRFKDIHSAVLPSWAMTGFVNSDILLNPAVQYWDTMIGHYLLSGQRDTMPSLADAFDKYKHQLEPRFPLFSVTKSWLSDQIANGVPPQSCEHDKIVKYLENDITVTMFIAALQMRECAEKGMTALALHMMRAMTAVTEMEHNGLVVDRDRALTAAGEALAQMNACSVNVETAYRAICRSWPKTAKFPAISSKTLDAVFFGGSLTSERSEAVGVYKSGAKKGLTKFGKIFNDHIFPAIVMESDETVKFNRTPTGERQWDEATLQRVHKYCMDFGHIDHANLLYNHLQAKHVQKQLSTYITPALSAKKDPLLCRHVLHHNLHQTTTATGRLSSSNPNLQNITAFQAETDPLNVKQLYISRYEEGQLIEADYKQIEIVALALLTGDPVLIDDINNGRDIHSATGSMVFTGTMTKEQRRIVKTINFGLIYGGGSRSLAEQAGVDVATATACIEAFFHRYPVVKAERTEWVKKVNMWRAMWTPCGRITKKGVPLKGGLVKLTPTGRDFYLEEEESAWGVGAPVTKIYNYPVQSFATGDIVPTMLGVLRDRLAKNTELTGLLMVNTVHDSILFDCPKQIIDPAMKFIKATLEEAPQIISKVYGLEFDLPLKVEIKSGKTWYYAA